MSDTDLEIRGFTVGPMQSNCYLLRAAGQSAVAVDPGADDPRLARQIEEWGGGLAAIVLTHAHLDHVAGIPALRREFEAPIHLHPDDLPLYERAPEQAESFGLALDELPPPERELSGGQRLRVAGVELEVRHAPGHSPGGVVLGAGEVAFVGDCLFAGSIGRTDLPGGNAEALMRSIREQILTLPPSTTLLPGHGPKTTVEREERSNPFLTGAFGWSG